MHFYNDDVNKYIHGWNGTSNQKICMNIFGDSFKFESRKQSFEEKIDPNKKWTRKEEMVKSYFSLMQQDALYYS